MALDAEALGAAIGAAINAKLIAANLSPGEGPAAPANAQFWTLVGEAVAEAVIEHLTTAAEVLPDGAPPLEADGDPVTGKGRIA